MLRILALFLLPTILVALRPSSESKRDALSSSLVTPICTALSGGAELCEWIGAYFGESHKEQFETAMGIFSPLYGEIGTVEMERLLSLIKIMDTEATESQDTPKAMPDQDVKAIMSVIKYFAHDETMDEYHMLPDLFDKMIQTVDFFQESEGKHPSAALLMKVLEFFDTTKTGYFDKLEFDAVMTIIPFFAGQDEFIEEAEFEEMKKEINKCVSEYTGTCKGLKGKLEECNRDFEASVEEQQPKGSTERSSKTLHHELSIVEHVADDDAAPEVLSSENVAALSESPGPGGQRKRSVPLSDIDADSIAEEEDTC